MSWNHGLFKNQKGVFLVFTAILLPIIFACAGLAMDLGNAFAHKSKLQNAADAAALAGAKTFAVNNETIDKHPIADDMAVRYANTNYQKEIPEGNRKLQAQTKDKDTKDEKTYYRVFLKDDVPATFMRILGVNPTIEVSVDAIATVPVDVPDPGINFGELLNLGNGFVNGGSINQTNGRDNDDGQRKIPISGTTFDDGHVVIYDENVYNQYMENNKSEGMYYYFESKALGMPRNEAKEKGFYREPQLGKDYNAEKNRIDKEIKDLFASKASEVKVIHQKEISLPDDKDKIYDYYRISGNNLKLNLKNMIRADTPVEDRNKPVYVFIDDLEWAAANIYLDEDITRPIIIYYGGDQNLHFYNQSHDYRGVFCAPNSYAEAFQMENNKFTGSIWANSIQLQSNHARFKFESFGGAAGSSGSESSGGESVKLKLVDGSGLTWR